ncbi:hypothetical protein K1W54_40200, partial [Micromonospora sp. CPCC 205371]|nr:hypothetical protein [Micromonospora sp. CPCC 205371]
MNIYCCSGSGYGNSKCSQRVVERRPRQLAHTLNSTPPIKDICMDQGQTHAEKRSNHVHSPLIGG